MISRKEKETTRRGQAVLTKRTALFGLLIALAFVLGYVESLMPIYLGAPGTKLGLADLVIMITLYYVGAKTAIAVNVVRVFLSGSTLGSTSTILFNLAGAAFSLTVMAMCRKLRLFGMVRVSILGGVTHNIGQFLMAAFVVHAFGIFSYLPVFLATGTVAGALIGLLGGVIVQRINRAIKEIRYKC